MNKQNLNFSKRQLELIRQSVLLYQEINTTKKLHRYERVQIFKIVEIIDGAFNG